jgi:hypothetical protein
MPLVFICTPWSCVEGGLVVGEHCGAVSIFDRGRAAASFN